MLLTINNFTKVEFYNSNDELLDSRDIIHSSKSNNEMLGMMDADFNEEEVTPLFNIMNKLNLTKEQFELISEIGMMQLDEDEEVPSLTPYESYVILPESKLIVLKLSKDCYKVRLIDSSVSTEDNFLDIIIDDIQAGIPDEDRTNKLLIVSQTSNLNEVSPSVSLHESSDNPHSDLGSKILLSKECYDILVKSEIEEVDQRIIHNKSLMELGVGTTEYQELTNLYELSVDDSYKLIIIN